MSVTETFEADPAELSPLLPGGEFNGPLLWWNHSLAFGGVERQILATSQSLLRSKLEPELLLEDLTPGKADVFLTGLRPYFKKISGIFDETKTFSAYAATGQAAAERHFGGLHPVRRQLIAIYAAYFATRKPRLVQVWNADYIHVALGALLAGVPNILTRCASLSPGFRFPLGVESVNDVLAKKVLSYLTAFPSFALSGISGACKKDYADWLGIDAKQIHDTPNAFAPAQWESDPDKIRALREKLRIGAGSPVIGGMFRLTRIKDPELWIATATAVLNARPDARAVLAGDGELFDAALSLARSSPFSDRIILPGMLTDAAAFYGLCDVFLHTAHCEGLGNVVMEAQYNKLPVVCTDCGGPADVIEDRRSGFLVRERDPRILAAHLLYALDNPAWAKAAGETGRQKVLRDFSAARCAMNYKKLYVARGCL